MLKALKHRVLKEGDCAQSPNYVTSRAWTSLSTVGETQLYLLDSDLSDHQGQQISHWFENGQALNILGVSLYGGFWGYFLP